METFKILRKKIWIVGRNESSVYLALYINRNKSKQLYITQLHEARINRMIN